jgi:hypothetical protein
MRYIDTQLTPKIDPAPTKITRQFTSIEILIHIASAGIYPEHELRGRIHFFTQTAANFISPRVSTPEHT